MYRLVQFSAFAAKSCHCLINSDFIKKVCFDMGINYILH